MQNPPFKTITGSARLKDYLGSYSRARGKLYGRVKVQTRLDFQNIKDGIVDWLHQGLHLMKEDYIQARQISTIGLLAYTHSVVDQVCTRQALERAVSEEIQQDVKLGLKLQRVACINTKGNKATTNIYSVLVDSRQVSKAVKGLR